MAHYESLWVLKVLLFSIFCTIAICVPTASKQGLREGEDVSNIGKRQGGVFSVLGVAGLGDGTPHPRLEIRQLEKNPDQWNIYLLGLRRLQNITQSDKLSYYQIAGECSF